MTVLLTGGAGYIGSHVAVELLQSGYDVIIADTFYNSSPKVPIIISEITGKSVRTYYVDIQNSADLEQIFKQHEINAVMHFAGYKAVGESVQQPLKYYRGNLDSTLTLLETMSKYQVKNLIFSSSATVYGNPATLPITEACPTGDIASPYGWTKYMIEQIITDYAAATPDFSAVIFRYFNPVGAHPSGLIGEAPNGAPNNLMPYITQVATGKRKQLSVFGADYDTPDGTCIRDYIHIMDIAAGHTAALPFCTSHKGVEVINLGTGMGHSVLELISAFENATGIHIPFQIVGRRAGDIPVCFASAEKAKALLGWQAFAVICLVLLALGQWSLFLSAESIVWQALLLIPAAARACAGLAVLGLRPMDTSQYAAMGASRGGYLAALAVLLVLAAGLPLWLWGSFAPLAAAAGYGLAVWYGYRNLDGMSGDISGFALTLGELCGCAAAILWR